MGINLTNLLIRLKILCHHSACYWCFADTSTTTQQAHWQSIHEWPYVVRGGRAPRVRPRTRWGKAEDLSDLNDCTLSLLFWYKQQAAESRRSGTELYDCTLHSTLLVGFFLPLLKSPWYPKVVLQIQSLIVSLVSFPSL